MSVQISPLFDAKVAQTSSRDYRIQCTTDDITMSKQCGIQFWLTLPEKKNQKMHYNPLAFHWIGVEGTIDFPHEGDLYISYLDGLFQKVVYEHPLHLDQRPYQQDSFTFSFQIGISPHIRSVGWRICFHIPHSNMAFTFNNVKFRFSTPAPNPPTHSFPPAPYMMAIHTITQHQTLQYVFSRSDAHPPTWNHIEWNANHSTDDDVVTTIQVPYYVNKTPDLSIPNEETPIIRPKKERKDPLYPLLDKVSYLYDVNHDIYFTPQEYQCFPCIQHVNYLMHQELSLLSLSTKDPIHPAIQQLLCATLPYMQPILPSPLCQNTMIEESIHMHMDMISPSQIVPILCFVLPPTNIVSIHSFERWLLSILSLSCPTYHIHIWIPIDIYFSVLSDNPDIPQWIALYRRIQSNMNSLISVHPYTSTDIPVEEQEYWESYISFQDIYRTMYDVQHGRMPHKNIVWIHLPIFTYIPTDWISWYQTSIQKHRIQIPLMECHIKEQYISWNEGTPYIGIPQSLFPRCNTFIEKLFIDNQERTWREQCVTLFKKILPSFQTPYTNLSYSQIVYYMPSN